MLLTKSNKVLGIVSISKAGISGTVTDLRIVLQYAKKGKCNQHNRMS